MIQKMDLLISRFLTLMKRMTCAQEGWLYLLHNLMVANSIVTFLHGFIDFKILNSDEEDDMRSGRLALPAAQLDGC